MSKSISKMVEENHDAVQTLIGDLKADHQAAAAAFEDLASRISRGQGIDKKKA